jgi:hypothetical protein
MTNLACVFTEKKKAFIHKAKRSKAKRLLEACNSEGDGERYDNIFIVLPAHEIPSTRPWTFVLLVVQQEQKSSSRHESLLTTYWWKASRGIGKVRL